MSARYQAANEGSHAKRYHAMLVPHPIKKKTHKKEKKVNPTMACQEIPNPMMAQQQMMFGGATDATMHPMACNPMMMVLPNQMMGMPNQMMMGLPNQMMGMPNQMMMGMPDQMMMGMPNQMKGMHPKKNPRQTSSESSDEESD
jgi:hypothetical protein